MKRTLLTGIIILLVVVGVTGCGNTTRASTKNKSREVTLGEVSFKMPEFLLEGAEEIEEFDDSLSFTKTYVRKDTDNYWCMNMNSFMVHLFVVPDKEITDLSGYEKLFYERGFRLGLQEEGMESGTDLNENPKLILDNVYCEALLSQELYEDYTGKAAVIRAGDKHICIYAGAKGRHAELDKKVIKTLDDIVYTMTLNENSGKSALRIDEELTNGKWAKVSVLSDRGELRSVNLTEIKVLTEEDSSVYQNQLEKRPPEGYAWQFVKLTGDEHLTDIMIKVKDNSLAPFETGSRTYTIFCEDGVRVDTYLIPNDAFSYHLEVGESAASSILKIE